MHVYVVYVEQRGQQVPEDVVWEHLPVETLSMDRLTLSLGACEVFVLREPPHHPVKAWHLVDAPAYALVEVVEDCRLKVVRAGEACLWSSWICMHAFTCVACGIVG